MKNINKIEYTPARRSALKYHRPAYLMVILSAAALLAAAASFGSAMAAGDKPQARPLDEKILELVGKNERLGLTAFGDIDGDKKDEIIITVDRKPETGVEPAPESKLAVYAVGKIAVVEDFSVYIEKLQLIDLDGCGNKEIIFVRRGGMKNLMEASVLKAERKPDGEFAFKTAFKSDGVVDGKFDIVKSSDTGGKSGDAPVMVIGGFLNAPGAIAPHVEFSHFYAYDKAAGRIKLARKHYERPKTLSQEYEMAYLNLLENNKSGAAKRLERIIKSAKNAKSEDSVDILRACEELLAKIKKD